MGGASGCVPSPLDAGAGRRRERAEAGVGGTSSFGPTACVLQDGDVQRHLYLQDVLTQVAEAPERPR